MSRARIACLSVLIGLLWPLSSQAQSVLTIVGTEELPGDGPGDNMVFSVRRDATSVVSLAFNTGEGSDSPAGA
jgi:hypothetical protein